MAYDLGLVYRTIEYVPDAECEYDFNITKDSPIENYGVKRNGVELAWTYDADVLLYSPGEVTSFGKKCNATANEIAKKRSCREGPLLVSSLGVLLSLQPQYLASCGVRSRKDRLKRAALRQTS